jgi:hypothetical protein
VTRALARAEAEARQAVDDWIASGQTFACYPGASALAMLDIDQKMLARLAEAFEVEGSAVSAFWSAYGLACARNSLDCTFSLGAWMMPWASTDIRARMLEEMTLRFGEAAITAFRAKSKLQ